MSDNYEDDGELDAQLVTTKANETVAMILGTSFYNGKKVNDWVNSICDSLLKVSTIIFSYPRNI